MNAQLPGKPYWLKISELARKRNNQAEEAELKHTDFDSGAEAGTYIILLNLQIASSLQQIPSLLVGNAHPNSRLRSSGTFAS